MRFKENIDAPKAFKEEYRDGIFSLIESREKELEKVRKEYAKDIFKSPEKYRGDLKEMLGWPLTQKREGGTSYTQEKLADEDGFEIIRMHFEIFEGVKLTGLLFKITDGERRPFVIAQHGGLGSPEHVAGINADSTENYHEMIDRILKCGANVFAPQLLIWDEKKYDVPYVRHEIDAKLKRVGSSISAVEIYGIQRIIDYFETQDYVGNIGMIGLSYGGFYTLYTSAVDTRIKSAVSCSFFNNRQVYSWVDWTWLNSAAKFNDAEIAALVYPRRLCVEVGDKDELFAVELAKEEAKRLKNMCGEVGCDWFDFIVFDGTHEFHKDDKPIERLVNDLR